MAVAQFCFFVVVKNIFFFGFFSCLALLGFFSFRYFSCHFLSGVRSSEFGWLNELLIFFADRDLGVNQFNNIVVQFQCHFFGLIKIIWHLFF